MAVKEQPRTQEPNIVIPLVSSYNQRDITGYTTMVTDGVDQRKVNWIYEPVRNSVSGNVTIYLANRPGVTDSGSSYGTSGQLAYLMEVGAGALVSSNTGRWVINRSGNDQRVSSSSQTTTLFTAAGYAPAYVDKTIIQGLDTVVVQFRNASGTQRVFFSSDSNNLTWTEISDSDFATLAHRGKMEFSPGRGHIMAGNRIYSSDLDTLTAWSATSFLTKQIQQDIGTGLARFGKFFLAFGENTFEVFHDVGNATGSPLEALIEKFQRYGLASQIVTDRRHYYTVCGDKFYWVGNPFGVYMYDGERVEKVSSPFIDKIITETGYYHLSTITFQGQAAVSITITDVDDTNQRGMLFFPEWKDWFEWSSGVFTPITGQRLTTAFLGVGSNQHKIYNISEATDNWHDNGTSVVQIFQFKIPAEGNQVKRMSMCGLIGDTARSASTMAVSWSNDDYQTFSTARNIDLTSKTKMIRQCGAYRDRAIKLVNGGQNVGIRLEKFIARVE